ncbi:MAG: D-alanyl-D-alanine carboxypeptidase/D-alanyl-D-alanine-endopeptidase [Melioribacteraceae bacterium]|nr:D-alanyl-D-alanine carboxypeptidase/D-alanyl-D-alanine-endopeptidase [Melioribacteraceae bacterium]
MRKYSTVTLAILLFILSACSSSKFTGDADKFNIMITEIDNVFNDSSFAHAHWGALIKSLDTGAIWYERNSQKVFMPASNQKIITTSSALLNLGADFKFTTLVATNGEIEDSLLNGDLIIIGNGDPTLYTKFYESPDQVFKQWSDSLKARGINHIGGRIIGYDDYFDDQELGQGWSFDYLDAWYAAPIGPLQFNENYIDLTITPGIQAGDTARVLPNIFTDYVKIKNHVTTTDTGKTRYRYHREYGSNVIVIEGQINLNTEKIEISPSIFNPTKFYITVLKEVLQKNELIIDGEAVDCDEIDSIDMNNLEVIISHESPPLSEIVEGLMKRSQNLYAETMVRILGLEKYGLGSFRNGKKVINESLSLMGIDENLYNYADGSGLTRYNFISPEQLVKILEFMYNSEFKDLWLDIQPIAGIDGTLQNRMKDTAAEKNVRAKTGTISNVRGLSGYLKTAAGENIVFSFLVNGHLMSPRDTEKITDSVLSLIAQFGN